MSKSSPSVSVDTFISWLCQDKLRPEDPHHLYTAMGVQCTFTRASESLLTHFTIPQLIPVGYELTLYQTRFQ